MLLSSNNLESGSSDSDDEKSSTKTKKVSKSRRTRRMGDNSKWSSIDEINYWKYCISYQIKRPYQNLSWVTWKCDSFYKEMAKFVGKTSKQCKSKDQNMKSKYGDRLGGNITEIAVEKLRKYANKDADNQEIVDYINEHTRLSGQVS